MAKGSWSRNHGTKIAHRFWLAAWMHATDLRRKSGEQLETYACYWQDNGNANGSRHWHVGHVAGIRNPGRPMPGDHSSRGRKGYKSVRVWLTEAEYGKLEQQAGEMHPAEYAARVILATSRDPALLVQASANSARNQESSSSSLSAGA